MANWVPVDTKNEKLSSGETYRVTFWLPLPDTLDWRNKVTSVLRNADTWIRTLPQPLQLGYNKYKIKKVETGAASATATNVRLKPWPVRIEFEYSNPLPNTAQSITYSNDDNFLGFDDAAEAFILLIGLIAIVAVGINVASKSIERLVKPIFNPAIAVLAVVGIAVIMKGRSK